VWAPFGGSLLGSTNSPTLSVPLSLKHKGELTQLTAHQLSQRFNLTYCHDLIFEKERVKRSLMAKAEKLLSKPHFRQQNSWMKALFEEPFLAKKAPPIYLAFIDRHIGYGLFAEKDIVRMTYIGEYVGVVRRRSKKQDRTNSYIFSCTVGPKETPYVIDAKERGNYVRFINHQVGPNCTSRWMIVDGLSHVIIYANKTIKKGEQLTYDYGPYFWRERPSPSDLEKE